MPAKQSLLQWPTAAPADEADGRKPSHAAAAAQLGRRRRYSAAAQLTLAGSIRCYECCALMSQPCHTLQRAMLCQRHSGTHRFASTDAENGQGKDLVPHSAAEGPAPWACGSDRTGAITYATFTAACCSIDMFAVVRELWWRSTDAISLETCPVRARASPEAHTHCAKEWSRGVARQGGQRLRSGRTACAVSGTSVWSCGAKVASCTQERPSRAPLDSPRSESACRCARGSGKATAKPKPIGRADRSEDRPLQQRQIAPALYGDHRRCIGDDGFGCSGREA